MNPYQFIGHVSLLFGDRMQHKPKNNIHSWRYSLINIW